MRAARTQDLMLYCLRMFLFRENRFITNNIRWEREKDEKSKV